MKKTLEVTIEYDEIPEIESHHIFLLSDEITNESVSPVIKFILERNLMPGRKKPKELKLIINSPGGDMYAAFSLIDTIKGSPIPVTTYGLGQIASAGLLIFMSGSRRLITPNTSILSHQYSGYKEGKHHDLYSWRTEEDLSIQRLINHYVKCTGLSEKVVKELLLTESDKWLSAEEAVQFKLADEIVNFY